MWMTECDIKFRKNANLGVGESSGCDPRLEMFFPDPEPEPFNRKSQRHEGVDPGLKRFLQNVQLVVESLERLAEESPDLKGSI